MAKHCIYMFNKNTRKKDNNNFSHQRLKVNLKLLTSIQIDTNSIIKLTSSQHGVRTMFVEIEVS